MPREPALIALGGFLLLTACKSSELQGVSTGVALLPAVLILPALVEGIHDQLTPPLTGDKPSRWELARLEANEKERREGVTKLQPGMTVDEIGKIMPRTFCLETRMALNKLPEFTRSVERYTLQFRRGTLTEVTPLPEESKKTEPM